MHRAMLVCAALAFGIFASPSSAQQTTPDQTLPPAQQTAPEVPPAPPPDLQTAPAPPPPFAPMPRARPTHRWVDINGRRASHAHRRAPHAHRSARHAHHRATSSTRKTERWCRSLSHRQKLRHSACRALTGRPHHRTKHRHHTATHRHHQIHHRRVHHHHKVVHRHRTRRRY
jgi:hypothetical protein